LSYASDLKSSQLNPTCHFPPGCPTHSHKLAPPPSGPG